MIRRFRNKNIIPPERHQGSGRFIAHRQWLIIIQCMAFAVVKVLIITEINSRSPREDTGSVRRHRIFDRADLYAFDMNYLIGIVMTGIENSVRPSRADFDGAESNIRDRFDIFPQRHGTAQA